MGQFLKPIKHPLFVPLLISALLILPMLLPVSWQDMLQYQRHGLQNGELWRLISGHLVHLSWGHLCMNLLGFWLIHLLFFSGRKNPAGTYLVGLLLLTLTISAGLFLFSTSVDWYRGFSGVLHGLLIWALLVEIREHTLTNILWLALLLTKLTWEQFSGPIPGSETLAQGRVIVDAHLYGGLSGALVWLLQNSAAKFRSEVVE